ncbi:hypothetical protein MRX96_009311 [Rhipicephalus microplus]
MSPVSLFLQERKQWVLRILGDFVAQQSRRAFLHTLRSVAAKFAAPTSTSTGPYSIRALVSHFRPFVYVWNTGNENAYVRSSGPAARSLLLSCSSRKTFFCRPSSFVFRA